MWPESVLDELRTRNSLEEVVSEYVTMRQKGRRFWGCCPFHNEKTPSFSVDTQSQLYYCFGCHKGGTVINFVMEMERMTFSEAVVYLAERSHMTLPEDDRQGRWADEATANEKEKIYAANVQAARYFHNLLWQPEGAAALSYLYKRGLNDVDIRRFGLGASPRGWDTLYQTLHAAGFSNEILCKAGLTVDKDGKMRDMFRERVIFPIINAQGKVLGFGGRAMGDAQPKYLNTPDTPVFNKRYGLYAINFLKKERSIDHMVLVEGYMDTVSLRKHGVGGVVATLGTALTPEQAKLFKRYVREIWISYDGDSAGQKAALRALDIFDEVPGIHAKVIDYPPGQDPDDFIKANGNAGFEKLRRYEATEYRLLRAADGVDMSDPEQKTAYVIRSCSIISKLHNPVEIDNYVKWLSVQTGYAKDVLLRQITSNEPDPQEIKPLPRQAEPVKQVLPESPAEFVLLTLMADDALPAGTVQAEDFSTPILQQAAQWIIGGNSVASFVENIEEPDMRSYVSQAIHFENVPSERAEQLKMAQETLDGIRKARSTALVDRLREELMNTTDEERRKELLTQINEVLLTQINGVIQGQSN